MAEGCVVFINGCCLSIVTLLLQVPGALGAACGALPHLAPALDTALQQVCAPAERTER